MRFYSFAYESGCLRGLSIKNSEVFIEMLFKEFLKYYPQEIYRNIRWTFDLKGALSRIITSYNSLADNLFDMYIKRSNGIVPDF